MSSDSSTEMLRSDTGTVKAFKPAVKRLVINSIKVKAPAKLILHGEHAVVYPSKKAIATTINLHTIVSLTPSTDKTISILNFKMLLSSDFVNTLTKCNTSMDFSSILGHPKDPCHASNLPVHSFLFVLSHVLLLTNDTDIEGFSISIESEIPIGAGLGSSASYSVCIATSLLLHFKLISPQSTLTNKELELINKFALYSEQILHGNPSGVDNTICTFGSALSYAKNTAGGCEISFIPNFLTSRIVLINTNIEKNTKKQVQLVADLKAKYPKVIDPIIDSIHEISEKFQSLFLNNEQNEETLFASMEELIDINHKLLSALGVSHPTLEKIKVLCWQILGLKSCKLTGAGGGGFALLLLPKRVDGAKLKKFIDTMKIEGFTCFESEIGVPGISFEIN